MTEYLVTLADGQRFNMAGNFEEASAPISVCFHDPEVNSDWQPTPFQTVDADYDPEEAANLVALYFNADDHDCTEVKSINVA